MKKRQLDQHRWVLYSHSADLGGAELSLLELAKLAHSRGVEIHVVLPRNGPIKKMLENAGITRISIIPTHTWMTGKFPRLLGIARLILIWLESPKISHYLKQVKPNLLIVNTSVIPGPIFAVNKSRIPTAVFVHEGLRSNKQLKSFLPKSWIVSLLKRKSDVLIVPSKFVGQDFDGACDVFAPIMSEPKQPLGISIKQHLSGPHKPLRLVMLGRISQDKGHLDAIKAVKLASEKGLNVHLSLYGALDASIPNEVKEYLSDTSRQQIISLRPPQEDIDAIYAQADLTLVLSRYETFGRVAAESVARAVPVIGYDIPATREILQHGGGILVSEPIGETVVILSMVISDKFFYRKLVQSCSSNVNALITSEQLIEYIGSIAGVD